MRLSSFAGAWALDRTIEDVRAGRTGRLTGAARFEPEPDAPSPSVPLEQQLASPTEPPPPGKDKPATGLAPEQEQESYTSRLLKAKKQVWDERK